jgi:uncharacterized glyoxalase superfamily protein PhnB
MQHHFPRRQASFDWLERALGAERLAVYEDDEGRVVHAELRIGAGAIMAGDERAGSKATPPGVSVLYMVVDDADAAYERAKAAGAEVTEPVDQDYGSRENGKELSLHRGRKRRNARRGRAGGPRRLVESRALGLFLRVPRRSQASGRGGLRAAGGSRWLGIAEHAGTPGNIDGMLFERGERNDLEGTFVG